MGDLGLVHRSSTGCRFAAPSADQSVDTREVSHMTLLPFKSMIDMATPICFLGFKNHM